MNLLSKIVISSAIGIFGVLPVQAAFNDAGTDYTNYVTDVMIDSGPAEDALNMVDFLLCVMSNSKATLAANQGASYSVLVDENICFGQKKPTPLYAKQTLTTSGSANPTAAAPYIIKSWFLTGDGMSVVAKSTVTQGATTTAPNGAFKMTWRAVAPSNMVGSKGELSFKADGTMYYIENQTQNAGTDNVFISTAGTLSPDGLSGQLRIKGTSYDSSGNPIYPLNRYVFDTSHLHYDTDGAAAQCYSRATATEKTRVMGYQLFTSAGAKKAMNGPFGFKYTSGGSEYNGWAHPEGAWLENKETNTNKPATITRRSDSQNFAICYDDDWETASGARYDDADNDNVAGVTVDTTNCGTVNDGVKLHLINSTTNVAYTFDAALAFNSVTFVDRFTGNSTTRTGARYDGDGSSLDLGWECLLPQNISADTWTAESFTGGTNSCNNAVNYRPLYHLPDGTKLTTTAGGVEYYVKAMETKRYLKKESTVTPCADIPLTGAPADAGQTAASIGLTADVLWADLPTVTVANTIKYIHGVAQ